MIHVIVGILANSEGKLLITQRPPDKPYAGYWEFPGGKVELDEDPRAALARELKEELGINVLVAESWQQCTHAYPDKTVFLDVWKVTQYQGRPQGREGQELRWVLPGEIKRMHILEGNYQLIERLVAASLCGVGC